MKNTSASTKRTKMARLIRVPVLKRPFPTEKEFDDMLRSHGFRPATKAEQEESRKAQARIVRHDLAA